MILSGLEIEKRLNTDIHIAPFNRKQLNPNSYNLRLHNELMIYTGGTLDMKKPNPTAIIEIPENGYTLMPGNLYLGRTLEHTTTDKYVPMLEGRSSIGRLGLCVHVTAGFGDIGFSGYWTLEMFCIMPVVIYPNVEICQIYFHEITGDYELYGAGKYNHNKGVQPSLLYKEFQQGD